jgi:hypothetical protein
MFQLQVQGLNLDGASVVLVKSTRQSYSVVCGLWPATGGLPTSVDIDAILYAYASTSTEELRDGDTISTNAVSSPLSEGSVYLFDGVEFVQGEQTPSDFDYGLRNGRPSSLTCGLCQDVTINGQPARPPVCVQRLLPGFTAYFPANDIFWLGIGQFPGPGEPQPGFLISTSIVEDIQPRVPGPPELAFGPFASVDFSSSTSLVATYQPASGSFQIEPAQLPDVP